MWHPPMAVNKRLYKCLENVKTFKLGLNVGKRDIAGVRALKIFHFMVTGNVRPKADL